MDWISAVTSATQLSVCSKTKWETTSETNVDLREKGVEEEMANLLHVDLI